MCLSTCIAERNAHRVRLSSNLSNNNCKANMFQFSFVALVAPRNLDLKLAIQEMCPWYIYIYKLYKTRSSLPKCNANFCHSPLSPPTADAEDGFVLLLDGPSQSKLDSNVGPSQIFKTFKPTSTAFPQFDKQYLKSKSQKKGSTRQKANALRTLPSEGSFTRSGLRHTSLCLRTAFGWKAFPSIHKSLDAS